VLSLDVIVDTITVIKMLTAEQPTQTGTCIAKRGKGWGKHKIV
jgi:hypothetical protein